MNKISVKKKKKDSFGTPIKDKESTERLPLVVSTREEGIQNTDQKCSAYHVSFILWA